MNGIPRIFVVSAPSGAGKHTLLERVLPRIPDIAYAVSATTRPPRQGETHGKEYYFLDVAEFRGRIDAGDFVEWAEVHGDLYGMLREELDRLLAGDKDVLLELDVQGMRSVRALYPDAVTVFIMPPSLEELERRLRARGTESDEAIRTRLQNARNEMACRDEFDFVVVNDKIERAATELERILRDPEAMSDEGFTRI